MIKNIVMSLVIGVSAMFAGGSISPVVNVDESKTGLYLGVFTGSLWNYEGGEFDFTSDTDYSVVDGVVGVDVGYTFYKTGPFEAAIEGRVYSTYNANDFDTTVYSTYLKPTYNINSKVGVYGLLGASHVRLNAGYESVSKNGFSWGLGAKYGINKDVDLFVDYTSHLWNKTVGYANDFNTDAVVVGLNYKF